MDLLAYTNQHIDYSIKIDATDTETLLRYNKISITYGSHNQAISDYVLCDNAIWNFSDLICKGSENLF